MRVKSIFFFLIFSCALNPSISLGDFRVVDGDTIHKGSKKFRLEGIDTPETGQSCLYQRKTWFCGRAAMSALEKKIEAANTIKCEGDEKDSYGRVIAICYADNQDLNAWMVKNGWALAYIKYSKKYLNEQQYAKKKGLGIWKGQFVAPWDWRRGKRLESTKNFQNGDCKIKGNISSKGEKIFHLPRGIYYDRTKISKQKGERSSRENQFLHRSSETLSKRE